MAFIQNISITQLDKFLRLIEVAAFALFLTMSISALAQPALDQTHPEWFQCQMTDECVAKCEACGDVAINKNYSNYSPDVVPTCAANRGCAVRFDEVAEAKCQNNQCAIVFHKDGQ